MQTITTTEKKSLQVGKYVTTSHVDTVIKNYKQERWVHNSERIGKEDSLSAWWSVEELENFLANAKDNGADGVKFYFGAYAADYQDRPEYAGRQTLVMVATKQKEGANGSVRNKDIYVSTDKGSQILAYNAANLCPPFCGDDSGIPGDGVGVTIIDKGEKGFVVI